MQETFPALKPTPAANGDAASRLVDGVEAKPSQRDETQSDEKMRARASILFVDDQRLTRDCLCELIADLCPEMTVQGLRSADYQERERPLSNVALIVFNLHGSSIAEAVRLLRMEARPSAPPVLFITSRHQRRETMEAVECGAMGLVRADARPDLLIAAMRLVIAGGSYFPAETITSLVAQAPSSKNLP